MHPPAPMHMLNDSSDIPQTLPSHAGTPEEQHSPHAPCPPMRHNAHSRSEEPSAWQPWEAPQETQSGSGALYQGPGRAAGFASSCALRVESCADQICPSSAELHLL